MTILPLAGGVRGGRGLAASNVRLLRFTFFSFSNRRLSSQPHVFQLSHIFFLALDTGHHDALNIIFLSNEEDDNGGQKDHDGGGHKQ